ncbi:MAG: prealbumin-like fold domain-containing protein [Clostridiales bacterium]|nr:prealbumin-like fold domain-containing protein [Clostridiales bacterium]
MGKKRMEEKIRRLAASFLCVILIVNTSISSLAGFGLFHFGIPVEYEDRIRSATEADADEEEDATASDASASDATASGWQAALQARIDALPGIEEIEEDETYQLLIETYWEVLDIMNILDEHTGTSLYMAVLNEDDGSIDGAGELDVSRLYEIADYVMEAYENLSASAQIGELTCVTDEITVEPSLYEGKGQARLKLQMTDDPTVVYLDQLDDQELAADVHESDYFSYMTGEKLRLYYAIDGGIPQDYVFRIFFQPFDPEEMYDALMEEGRIDAGIENQLSFVQNSGGEIDLGDYSQVPQWDEDMEAWYVEFAGVSQSETCQGYIQLLYPSPDTPGGDVLIFGVIYDSDGETVVSSNRDAFDASWKTKPDTFQVALALDETQEEKGLILEKEEESIHVSVKDNSDEDLIWTIRMEDTTEESLTDQGIGEDLISYICVSDRIVFPVGIGWDGEWDGIVSIVNQTEEYFYISFYDTDGHILLTLVNRSENEAKDYALTYDAEARELNLSWTILNSSIGDDGFAASQIDNGEWEIRLNGDDLILQDESAYESAADSHTINNVVRYEYHYDWSGTCANEAIVSIDIAGVSSHVILSKTSDRSGTVYMGEDAYYTVSLFNQGATATDDLKDLTDSALDATQYFTPENIWKMFFGVAEDLEDDRYLDEDSGKYLTILITEATVYYHTLQDLETVNDMDGNASVYKTNANYLLNTVPFYIDATITMTREDSDESVHITFAHGDAVFYETEVFDPAELKLIMSRIGYVVTADATYHAVWDLTDHQLSAGETRHYKIYSTLKDTFQYHENVYLNYADSYHVAENTVYLDFDNTGKNEGDEDYLETQEATAEYTDIMYDFEIEKRIYQVDGESVEADDTDVFYRNSVITYQLYVNHYGTGVAEDLPLIDEINGSQYLLVPVNEQNNASIEQGKWNYSQSIWDQMIVEYEDVRYYQFVLGGTYYDVWLDDTHCASSVVVSANRNRDNDTFKSNMSYVVTWNYDSFGGSDGAGQSDVLTYQVQISSNTYVTDAQNTVYLNGRYEERGISRLSALYDEIDSTEIKSGSLNKQILTSEPEEDSETFAYLSVLDLNDTNDYKATICYKLLLETGSGNSEITFRDVKDILPYTYGVFDWTKENVRVYQYSYAAEVKDAGSGETIAPDEVSEFEILYTDENGDETGIWQDTDGRYMTADGEPAYQTVCWGDLTIPMNARGIWIYMELDFAMDAVTWAEYTGKISGNLRNTLSAVTEAHATPDTASVIHAVKTGGQAYLQKGVFWISDASQSLAVSAVDSREIYYNASTDMEGNQKDGSRVAYYIQLYNAGSSYLYLTEIQDLAPDGFVFTGLYSGAQDYQDGVTGDVNDQEGTNASVWSVSTDPENPASEVIHMDGSDEKLSWLGTTVTARVGDDGILRYGFSGGDLKTDETTGYSYLEQNEAISFIAEFEAGTESETEKYAVNKIGMPYLSLAGEEVTVAYVNGAATDVIRTDVQQNVGGCNLIGETERMVDGFQAVTPTIGDVTQWMISDVTVRSGSIIPGIHKSVEEEGGLAGSDAVTWEIEVTNDGSVPMSGYTIVDRMDNPFRIEGDIFYVIYDRDGQPVMRMYSTANDETEYPLLSISREDSSYTLTWYSAFRVWMLEEEEKDIGLGESGVIYPSVQTWSYSADSGEWEWGEATSSGDVEITVTIDVDDDTGSDILSLCFSDSVFMIPAGGRGVLTIQTAPEQTASVGTYYNLAKIIPDQSYNDAEVTIGEAVAKTDETPAYVRSSDQISINNGYTTKAQKWIQSMDDASKVACSETTDPDSKSYLILEDENETFTYTLEVTNRLDDLQMHDLILIDTLPQNGDYAPFTVEQENTSRGSDFRVDLLEENLGWSVVVGDKIQKDDDSGMVAARDTVVNCEEITNYTVHYSTSVDLGLGNTTEGKTAARWGLESVFDDGTEFWTENPAGARAIRIEIFDNIEAGKAIQVSFHARVATETENEAEKAEPGEIGWNSFAYRYTTVSSESAGGDVDSDTAEVLWAAPRKVGVMIPNIPRLKKVLEDTGEDAANDMETEDKKFRFLIHEGDSMENLDYSSCSEEDLVAILDEAGVRYFVTDLEVTDGTEEEIYLDPGNAFSFIEGEHYTVVELLNDSGYPGNDRFLIQGMETGAYSVQSNVITFPFSAATAITVTARNRLLKWSLLVVKVDGKNVSTALPDVVFGLYSPVRPEAGVYRELMESYGEILTELLETIETDGTSWYLTDVQSTDENGNILWTGLSEPVYYLKELKTAEGYYLPDDPIRMDYWNLDDNQEYSGTPGTSGSYPLVITTITNEVGYILPKSGGFGIKSIQLAGLLLMGTGTYIACKEKFKSREEES